MGNFLKTNGQSAKVYGLTFDYRLNFNEKIELESSFTMQRSKHLSGISYSSELENKKIFENSKHIWLFDFAIYP